MSVNHSGRSAGIVRIFFSIFFNIKLCCVLSLKSPHRGDSSENTQHIIIKIRKKIFLNYPKYNKLMSAAMCCFHRDSRTSSKQPW